MSLLQLATSERPGPSTSRLPSDTDLSGLGRAINHGGDVLGNLSNAILDGTDAIMLSAETASGDYPIEAVQMMVHIALETEAGDSTARQPQCQRLTQEHAVSHAARALSEEASVKAIVVFTRSGTSARLISKDRPRRPILAYTPSERVYRQIAL